MIQWPPLFPNSYCMNQPSSVVDVQRRSGGGERSGWMATSTLPLSTFVGLPSSPPISKSTTYLLFLPLPPSPTEGFPRRIRCRNPAASRAAVRVFCGNRGNSYHREGLFKEFSVLPPDSSWDDGDVWYIFGAYLFAIHVPLSFGGIAAVSKILGTPVVDPLTEAVWALILQTMELMAVLILLNHTAKSEFGLPHILTDRSISKGRNWIMASVVGLGILVLLVVITSFLADQLIGTKDVNDPVVQEMMISSSASKAVCLLVYCFSTPLLEELVYRRFLLRSLATTMNWQNAVLVTSVVFSLAHFSSVNALQLFVIGSVLGSVYCWSGNLASSIIVHSIYNAAILMATSSG